MKPTHILLLATAVILIGVDIYWASNRVPGDTISEVILAYARMHPVIPFAFGVLMGHLLWPQQ